MASKMPIGMSAVDDMPPPNVFCLTFGGISHYAYLQPIIMKKVITLIQYNVAI